MSQGQSFMLRTTYALRGSSTGTLAAWVLQKLASSYVINIPLQWSQRWMAACTRLLAVPVLLLSLESNRLGYKPQKEALSANRPHVQRRHLRPPCEWNGDNTRREAHVPSQWKRSISDQQTSTASEKMIEIIKWPLSVHPPPPAFSPPMRK